MDQPNIVFLFSDQQRWDTVSCYGQPLGARFHLTPNLDRLAAEGMRFDGAYTCQPVCGPARACLQTGKYPTEIGCEVNDRMLPKNETGIAYRFNEAGYETAYVGKWHLASHHSSAGRPDSLDYKTKAIPPELRGGYRDYWVAADVLEFTSHGYGGCLYDGEMNRRAFSGYRADAVTDFALEYLARPKTRPFFLFVSYIEPHYQNDHGHHEGPLGSKNTYRDFSVPADLEGTGGDWREEMPDYLGCCASLDENVGRIVEVLKQCGQYDNTVLFYSSDHGSHFRTRNGEYKRSCHDASLHVPLIIRGGCFLGGRTVSCLTSLIDLPPTLLACAGITPPPSMRGLPLQRLAETPTVPIREDVFVQISESCVGRALRTDRWTYCVEAPKETENHQPDSPVYHEAYLYDNEADPAQRRNLIREPAYAKTRDALRLLLRRRIWENEQKKPEIYTKGKEAPLYE